MPHLSSQAYANDNLAAINLQDYSQTYKKSVKIASPTAADSFDDINDRQTSIRHSQTVDPGHLMGQLGGVQNKGPRNL